MRFEFSLQVSKGDDEAVLSLPMSGTASDVVGIFSATRLRKTVNERRMVTPEINTSRFDCHRAKEFTEEVLV